MVNTFANIRQYPPEFVFWNVHVPLQLVRLDFLREIPLFRILSHYVQSILTPVVEALLEPNYVRVFDCGQNADLIEHSCLFSIIKLSQ